MNSFETFHHDAENPFGGFNVATDEGIMPSGFYYWFCQPGCLPDGEPMGPYKTREAAINAATGELYGDDERYRVIVGNIGEVESCNDRATASRVYNEYVALSKRQTGRAAGEDVTIMEDGEPIREYIGN